ncbi:PREDICTED: probable sucrose-phosphate synthase 2 [Camelina sativa]|uniref:Sucrose-phosphate synthase n=1 Tax=Camelina sativa TaxID=90675 RepID=A0ABM0T1V8_CAMSA|nr:PREDICTED: probable sucrose-phosphate synthase 2 [Camelina sativa]
MVGNDWVNSYLEAILAAEPGIGNSKSSLLLRERGHFSPTRYFVEEVITGFDETDLHRSWVQAAATRSPQERNTRLENLCWRIWNLARQKKQVEGKNAKRAAKRQLEREKARREVTADMSEDFSEGEKADLPGEIPTPSDSNTKGRMSRISSVDVFENWFAQHNDKKLYIVLISLHGLIRGENMELGRDSDTGGQVKYVVELARALGSMPGVYRVDLLTRQVSAPDVDSSYSEPSEMLNPLDTDTEQEHGESSGAYIIRIPFGPKDKYVPKELLWPHIPEFVDRALSHVMQISKVLGEQIGGGQQVWPVSIHGHYADAGDSAALLSGALNVPMVFTGHSLGRDKLEQLLKQGRPKEEINSNYKIMRRIEAEELCLDASEIIITSTRQEIEEQWRLYDGFDPVLERKLRARMKRGVSCLGRFMPRMVVIPPGMEFHHIVPHDVDADGDDENPQSADPPIWSEIMRFFSNPRKPMILALARPDPKKNLVTLVKAFGECRPLRELANLTLIMGNRNDIDELSSTNASVLLSILKLIDKYDLYGQVAMPKHHQQSDVPEIYRLAAKTKGVFINPAFIEPFGLTLIEAGAHGLPTVATINGGPVDIHRVLDNGLLVDPHNQQAIADALLKLVSDKQLWGRCRQNGLKNIHLFSWPEHCKTYLARIASCKQRHPKWQRVEFENSDPDSPSDSLRDIHDISLNLKLSLDGEKGGSNSGVDTNLDAEDSAAERKAEVEKAVSTLAQKSRSAEKVDSKMPTLKRRKHIFVISVDCGTTSDLLAVVKTVIDAAGKGGSIGFILSTSMTISETHTTLLSGGLKPQDFDAVICNSGSGLYFTSSASEDKNALPYTLDADYHSHIEFRWGGESLRKTLIRWISSVQEKKKAKQGEILAEDASSSTNYCLSFKVKDPASIPPMKELRKLMRIQALRCNVVYCQNGARLNVIPVLASRSQALRYLLVRWGIDLSNMVVFVGGSGDTDYEGLLGGIHKTVILKGLASDLRELHGNRSYPMEDVTPLNSPNIAEAEKCGRDAIKAALEKLGISLPKP